MSEAILILGMHRSGTSALAGALGRLGVALGDRLVPGSAEDNPGGFYEHRDVVAAHEAAMLQQGRTWDDPFAPAADAWEPRIRAELVASIDEIVARDFADAPLWAVKDPRLCRTFPCWLDALDARGIESRCILILRSPQEVARSLALRDGFSSAKSAVLWIDHVLGGLRATAGRRRARLRFEELLENPVETLARCARDLDLSWPRDPSAEAAGLGELLRPQLRHHRNETADGIASPAGRLATDVWNRLRDARDWPSLEEIETWERSLHERSDPPTALLLEHATQVAERLSRDHSWATETRLRGEMEEQLTALEKRVGKTVDDVAAELARQSEAIDRQSRESFERGETLSMIERRSAAAERRLDDLEHTPGRALGRALRRLVGRDR